MQLNLTQPAFKSLKTYSYARETWDNYIPGPGEVMVIQEIDTQKIYVKIGNGKTILCDLPEVHDKLPEAVSTPLYPLISKIPSEVWNDTCERFKYEDTYTQLLDAMDTLAAVYYQRCVL